MTEPLLTSHFLLLTSYFSRFLTFPAYSLKDQPMVNAVVTSFFAAPDSGGSLS